MESALNVFYAAMAIYGWTVWASGRSDKGEMQVTTWPVSVHARAVVIIVTASLVCGYLLSRFTDAEFPYTDSLITWSAVWATFLVARKVLENWWYWIIIDLASVFVYWSRDLQLTSLLFVAYVIMVPFGLISWSRTMRREQA
jgi:nicotinamide mononucleotide transporter